MRLATMILITAIWSTLPSHLHSQTFGITKKKQGCRINETEGYMLCYSNIHPPANCDYPFLLSKLRELTSRQKMELIKDLLRFQGDTARCSLPVLCYSAKRATVMKSKMEYAIQVQALYFINMIISKDPFGEAPYPIVYNRKTGKMSLIGGDDVSYAFEQYRSWYQVAQRRGLAQATRLRMPLQRDVCWYP